MAGEAAPVPGRAAKLYYGAGAIAFGVKDQGFGTFLMLFYNQVLGLPASEVGLALMIALLVDAVLDPLIGHVSDNWRSRWGRRHPFLYGAALPSALTFMLLWNPPSGLGHGALFLYLVVVAVVVRACIATVEIPSAAQVAELTTGYDQRTSFIAYRFFFGWVAGLTMAILGFSVFLTPDAEHPVGQLNPAGYGAYGIAAGIVMLVSVLVSAAGTHRYIRPYSGPTDAPRPDLRTTLAHARETLSERAFLVMLAAGVFGAMAVGLSGALNVYYGTFFWNLSADQISILVAANFVSAALALALAPALSARLGKKRVYVATALAAVVLGSAPMFLRLLGLFPENGSPALMPILFVFTAVTTALGIVASIVVSSMVVDVVEHAQLRTGRRSEGLFLAASAFAQKCVSGVGLFLGGVLLDLARFPTGAQPGPEAFDALVRLVMIQAPTVLVLYLIAIWCVSRYPIDRAVHEANLARLGASGTP